MPQENTTSNTTAARTSGRTDFIADILLSQNGRRIGIFPESFHIAIRKNLNHPTVEIIDRMILNGAEPAVVFPARLVDIAAHAAADIFLLASGADVGGVQKFDVLHGHFGGSIGA